MTITFKDSDGVEWRLLAWSLDDESRRDATAADLLSALGQLSPGSDGPTEGSADEGCARCGDTYELRANSEDSGYCDPCAHDGMRELRAALALGEQKQAARVAELLASHEAIARANEEGSALLAAAESELAATKAKLAEAEASCETYEGVIKRRDEDLVLFAAGNEKLRSELASARRVVEDVTKAVSVYPAGEGGLVKRIRVAFASAGTDGPAVCGNCDTHAETCRKLGQGERCCDDCTHGTDADRTEAPQDIGKGGSGSVGTADREEAEAEPSGPASSTPTQLEPPLPTCEHQPVGGNDGTWCWKCYADLSIRANIAEAPEWVDRDIAECRKMRLASHGGRSEPFRPDTPIGSTVCKGCGLTFNLSEEHHCIAEPPRPEAVETRCEHCDMREHAYSKGGRCPLGPSHRHSFGAPTAEPKLKPYCEHRCQLLRDERGRYFCTGCLATLTGEPEPKPEPEEET